MEQTNNTPQPELLTESEMLNRIVNILTDMIRKVFYDIFGEERVDIHAHKGSSSIDVVVYFPSVEMIDVETTATYTLHDVFVTIRIPFAFIYFSSFKDTATFTIRDITISINRSRFKYYEVGDGALFIHPHVSTIRRNAGLMCLGTVTRDILGKFYEWLYIPHEKEKFNATIENTLVGSLQPKIEGLAINLYPIIRTQNTVGVYRLYSQFVTESLSKFMQSYSAKPIQKERIFELSIPGVGDYYHVVGKLEDTYTGKQLNKIISELSPDEIRSIQKKCIYTIESLSSTTIEFKDTTIDVIVDMEAPEDAIFNIINTKPVMVEFDQIASCINISAGDISVPVSYVNSQYYEKTKEKNGYYEHKKVRRVRSKSRS